MPNLKLILQVLLLASMLTIGNVLWKYGLNNIGGIFVNGKTFFSSIKDLFLSPYIWLGALLYILGTIYWFTLLSKHNLSYVYPMLSVSYVLGMIVGMFFFKEAVSLTGWIGMGIIFVGFIILSIG
jgi:uncharacterized membrane protein